MIQYQENIQIGLNKILHLYKNVGWTAYTNNPEKLKRALAASLWVISAWDGDELVGLIRAVGDGETIIYIQDILVLKSFQRKGIGKILLERMMNQFPDVRQKILLTDDTNKTRSFYSSLGFNSCDDGKLIAFAHFN